MERLRGMPFPLPTERQVREETRLLEDFVLLHQRAAATTAVGDVGVFDRVPELAFGAGGERVGGVFAVRPGADRGAEVTGGADRLELADDPLAALDREPE